MGAKAKRKRVYGLAEAKAKLSEIVAKARTEGPQRINFRGKPAAYVVSAEEWERRSQPRGTLLDWFKQTGVYGLGVDLDVTRDARMRDLNL